MGPLRDPDGKLKTQMQGNFRSPFAFSLSMSPPRDLILISTPSWETCSASETIQQGIHLLGDSGGTGPWGTETLQSGLGGLCPGISALHPQFPNPRITPAWPFCLYAPSECIHFSCCYPHLSPDGNNLYPKFLICQIQNSNCVIIASQTLQSGSP